MNHRFKLTVNQQFVLFPKLLALNEINDHDLKTIRKSTATIR